jgi:CubicO group peptidase (beta-lactamase class C family)
MRHLYILLLFYTSTALAQPPLTAKLDSFFRTQSATSPGIVLSIEKHGDIIYRNAAGLANLSTKTPLDSFSNFRLASMTKQFTAMGILLLEKDGRLTVDDPIGRWLPELPAGIGHKVLIRHLLTHSSGVLDYESLIPATQTTQILDADVLRLLSQHDSTYFPPGSQFRYSNSGFCLLALIIEKVSGQSFAGFIKERIFLPLHMNNSTVYQQGQPITNRAMGYAKDSAGTFMPSDQSITSATKGDGGIYTSLVDYSKWTRALQENTLLKLPAALHRLRFPIAGDSYYAAGWFIKGFSPVFLFHSGSTSGFQNFVIQVPGDEWTIVCFSNLADNITPFRDVLKILKDTGMYDLQVWSLHDLTR